MVSKLLQAYVEIHQGVPHSALQNVGFSLLRRKGGTELPSGSTSECAEVSNAWRTYFFERPNQSLNSRYYLQPCRISGDR